LSGKKKEGGLQSAPGSAGGYGNDGGKEGGGPGVFWGGDLAGLREKGAPGESE